jgi:hypothetical protein
MMTHKDPVALTSRPLDKLRVSAATIHIFFIHRRFQFIQYVHGNAGDVAAYFFVDQLLLHLRYRHYCRLNCPGLRDAAG